MDATERRLPAAARVGRVCLRVADLDRVASFYESVVGLTVQRRDGERATLGAGDGPLLELVADPDAPERPAEAAGLFHLAVRVPSRTALAETLVRVEDRWRLTGASDHGVSEALYLDDPEGNGVEVYRDRPRDEWPTSEGRVEMYTRPLDLDALRADAAEGAADRVPDETDLGHVHLEVASLADARAFYVDALGANVRQAYGDSALFLAAGDYHHHVGLNTWNRRTEPVAEGAQGVAWVEVVLPDADSLADARRRFEAAGVAVRDGDDGVTVTGPDGIELRLGVA
jgi:catechol 2,3-dioxygenase